jgi:hypothetical protein
VGRKARVRERRDARALSSAGAQVSNEQPALDEQPEDSEQPVAADEQPEADGNPEGEAEAEAAPVKPAEQS